MNRHEFLQNLHEVLAPRTYLEVGVNDGRSLTMSRVPSIAIDPGFKLSWEVHCDLELARATSDDFFARTDPVAHLPGGTVDFGFIDGMHLAEFALRDFMNIERFTTWTSVVIFDDALPRSISEAARDRHTMEWAGDVYKVGTVLQRLRPDLVCLPINTAPTGLLLVLGLDRDSHVLHSSYDDLLPELTSPDPQPVPDEVLQRRHTADPEQVLASSVWPALVAARSSGSPRDAASYGALRGLAGTGAMTPVVASEPRPWPPVTAAPKATPKRPAPSPPAANRSRLRRRTKRALRQLAARL